MGDVVYLLLHVLNMGAILKNGRLESKSIIENRNVVM